MTDVLEAENTTSGSQRGPNSQGDFIWYELMTPDPDGAKVFYDAVVGWKIADHADPGAGGMDYRMIERSDSKESADGGNAGGVLRLTDDMVKGGARPCWLGYISVDDVDKMVDAIIADGGKLQMPAVDLPVGRIAMVTDPQGAPFYVMKPTPPPGKEGLASDVFSPDKPGRVSWNELATSDLEAAKRFYPAQFGWTLGDAMNMGDMGDYQFITFRGVPLGAMMTAASENHPRWRFYFRVADVDAAKQAVDAGGGTVIHGPQEVPGGDRILIGTDPQGAEFAVVGK